MVEHSLDKVSGHKHLFGENFQQLVVNNKVSLHTILWHLLQSSVDKLYVTPPSDVSLQEDLHHLIKRGLGFGLFGHLLKEVVMGDQRLVLLVVIVGEILREGLSFGTHWAAVETPNLQ